jgi:hypothetical protein
LHNIYSKPLLKELIKYNNSGNFDRVDSMLMMIAHIYADQETITILHNQMLKRHKNRKRDIERYYRNEDS